MSIPTNITGEHLHKAIEKIDREGVPPNGNSQYYDVLFEGKRYPPKLVVSYANLFANGEILDRLSFTGGLETPCFELLEKNHFNIVSKNGTETKNKEKFYPLLKEFIEQSKTHDLSYKKYGEKRYRGLNVRASFGKGNQAKIPWIAFLGEDDTVQKGIYPVFQLYKDLDLLVLAYGISEANTPETSWKIENKKTIQEFFNEKNYGTSERYGNSYIFKSYDLNEPLNKEQIEKDLNEIIDEYIKSSNLTNGDSMSSQKQAPSIAFDFLEFTNQSKNSGLYFSKLLVTRFIASLATKPFVILTGLSGSGKTKLAQAFAKWICENEEQLCIVPVGADWTNREPLLGYSNAIEQDQYVKPENGILDLLIKSKENRHKPYFIILDEMNLSHVERYFADFLSIMETGEDIVLYEDYQQKNGAPAKVSWPKNVFIVGTVNIDETTYMFSPKVLDRANTIEFRITAEEMKDFLNGNIKPDLSIIKARGANMAANFLEISSNTVFEKPDDSVNATLLDFFRELKKTGAEFGYRSASEIHHLLHNLTVVNKELKEDEKIDIAIMQKLLPKLHGSRRKLVPVLKKLGQLCLSSSNEKIESDVFLKTDFSFNDNEVVKYPLSLEKLSRMYNGVIENGFASYAEA